MSGREQNPFGLPEWTPPPIPASMPTMAFIHGGNDTYHRLRGGPVFETMRDAGFRVALPDGGGVEIRGSGRILALMELNLGCIEWAEAMRDTLGAVVLVDVVAPIWNVDKLIELDSGARAYWSDPENVHRAMHLIRIADGITTPHPGYTEVLMDLNDQVFVLSDLDEVSEESVIDFTMRLQLAWHSAAEAKAARLREATATV